jgi:hypothetical protein
LSEKTLRCIQKISIEEKIYNRILAIEEMGNFLVFGFFNEKSLMVYDINKHEKYFI